jgi:hypothetical protein
VTSGTELNHDAGLKQLTTGRNADVGLTFFRHPGIFIQFQHHIARITSISSRLWMCTGYTLTGYTFNRHQQYGRAGCIPFYRQLYGRDWCVPFHRQQYERPGCSPFHHQQGVFKSFACSVGVQGVYISFFLKSDCPASVQSGTGTNKKKKGDTGSSSVPEKGDPVRYRNAPVPD